MATITYTTINTQIASLLRIADKAFNIWGHWFFDDDADFNNRLIEDEFDKSINEEALAHRAALTLLEAQAADTGALFVGTRDVFDEALTIILDADLATAAVETEMVDYVHEVLANGQVNLLKRTGKLGALHNDMVDNSENVVENTVIFGALTPEDDNRGTMVFDVSPNGSDHSLTGKVTLEILSDVIGLTTASILYEFDRQRVDRTELEAGDFQPVIGQSFVNGFTGLDFTLGQGTIIETDPTGFITVPAVATPSSGDPDAGGNYFLKITRRSVGPIWLLELFNLADRDPGDKVGSDTSDTTVGTDAISIVCNNGSVVTFTFNRVTAAANIVVGTPDESVIIDIDNPREGDKFTFTVSNDEVGEYATKLANIHPASFPSGPVASANFPDSQATTLPIP